MNIINIEHISKVFGEKVIFDDASFGIEEYQKIGIIGMNGTGKTTLLRMIAGLETPDLGQIIRQNNLRIAYLAQNPEFPENATVMSYALDGADNENWKVQSNLTKLGIDDYDALMADSAERLLWQRCWRLILTYFFLTSRQTIWMSR